MTKKSKGASKTPDDSADTSPTETSKDASDTSDDSADTSPTETSQDASDTPADSADTSSTETSQDASDTPADSADTSPTETSKDASDTPDSAGEPAATDVTGDSDSSDSGVVWQSGDWQKTNNATSPYNGIEMQALPIYSEQGTLASLTLNFTDFTNNADGSANSFTVPIKDGSVVTLTAEGDFTISGTVELRFFATAPDNVVIFFPEVSYGLEHHRHHVVGGVLIIPQTGTPTPAAPPTTASDSPAPDEGSSEGGDPQDTTAQANSPATSETSEVSQS
jgi:hypothetical protein